MVKKVKPMFLFVVSCFITVSTFCQGVKVIDSTKSKDAGSITTQDLNSIIIGEKSATFMGGDINSFRDWVQRNLVYSPIAVKQKIFGRVYVKYTIDENGKLCEAEIYKGVHPLIDNEALRVIKSSPLWEPGTIDGMKVKQSFVMPVIFLLK
jgi:TonB family protein